MTKVHLIAIAVVAIILLVIFGHNPMETYRKRALMRANQTLVNRIMKQNDPSFGKKVKNPPPRSDGIDMGADTSADKENTEVENNYNGNNRYRGTSRPIGGVRPYTSSGTVNTPSGAQSGAAVPSGADNYYPPIQPNPRSNVQPYVQPYAQPVPSSGGAQAAPTGDGYYPPTQ